jgi:TonB family protein
MKFSSPIMVFIIASASVHAAIVMTSNNSTTITLPGSTGSVMVVKIKEQQTNLSKKTLTKTISRNTSQQQNFAQTNKNHPSVEKPEKSSQQEHIDKITVPATDNQQTKSKARIISIIYEELSQHFNYPKLAQKRNWQGKVMLSLRVTANGEINNVRIKNSSGYSILDQAAINSLIKIGYLPQVSSWLPYDIDLKLPVLYQLTEG